jgi:hypothetical protein
MTLHIYRLFNGTSCKESLIGSSWAFYSMLALSIFGIFLVTFRAALYKIKVLHEENVMIHDITNHHDSIIDWNEKQPMHRGEYLPQKNPSKRLADYAFCI